MVFIAFHQIPGTHLPVPASWQYHADDLSEHENIDSRLVTMEKEDPEAMDSATLYSWRQHLLHELGVLDDEFNQRRKAKNYLVPRNEVPWESPADNQTTTLIAPELGFDIHTLQLSVRVVPPGHSDDTFHSHGEAVHYFLSGQGHQIVGDESMAVETGDLVFVPAGTAHGIRNSTGEPMRFLIAEQLPGTYLQRPVISQE
jgi:mannose-6-phosphate isomerase-like protein (cupin superfamily)